MFARVEWDYWKEQPEEWGQIANPDWSASVDFDGEQSMSTRKAFLDRYADRPVLVIGTHFAGPTAGHVIRDGDAYRLDCE